MERKVRVLVAFAWALSLLASMTAGYALYPLLSAQHGRLEPKANVIILWERPGGVDELYIGNVITDIGLQHLRDIAANGGTYNACLLYTSPSPRDRG